MTWNGPSNIIERIHWMAAGSPDYASWLKIKWRGIIGVRHKEHHDNEHKE